MEKSERIEKFLVTLEQNGTMGEMQQSVILSGEMNSLGGINVVPTNKAGCSNYQYSSCSGINQGCINYGTACGGSTNEACTNRQTGFNPSVDVCKKQ